MPQSKKRKHSGLTGLELLQALKALDTLKKTKIDEGFEDTEEEDTNDSAPEDIVEQIDRLLAVLGSKLEGPHV
jgi:hypothetical protein